MRFPKHPSHFAIRILLLACLISFNNPLRLSSLAQSNDDEAIRKLVGRIFELHQQRDIDKLLALWSKTSPFLAQDKKGVKRLFDLYEKIAVKSFDIRQRKIEGEQITLRVVAEMALTRARMERPIERKEKKNRTIRVVKENGIWRVWGFAPSEEELAMAIIAAKTEEEQKALMEKEPELRNSDLAFALLIQPPAVIASERGYQHALAIVQLGYKLAEQTGDKYVMAVAFIQEAFIHGWVGTPEKYQELALEYLKKSMKIGEEF
jgi:hypothetical protein